MAEDRGVSFDLLSDADLRVIDSYGVRHREGGMMGQEIARPAVFLIDRGGSVRWRWVTDNWRVRVRPQQVLEAMSHLSPGAAGGK